MSETESRRGLVVGAGIGGLAAAISLEHAGYEVTVLEQAAQLRELGFALLLAPNAMRALRLLGVAEAVTRSAGVARSGELRRLDGTVLKRVDIRRVVETLGESTVCALRPVVHGALLGALGEQSIRTAARAQAFTQDAAGVTLQLANGESLRADLLIGADGLHSVIRQQLHGHAPLRPSGLVGFRGVARDVTFEAGDGAQYFGAGMEAGVGNAGGGCVYWYFSVPEPLLPTAEAAPKSMLQAVLAERNVDPALLRLIERTEAADMRMDPLLDRAPLERWGEGRVTLLGDAAHPMLPHAGQGAAQSLEDAIVLGRSLSSSSTRDVPGALQHYEAQRRPRSAHLVRTSRRNARMGSLDNPLACALRDTVIRMLPGPLLARQLIALSRAPF
jgi:2-polyprenyl-6-methoxyphenol hydroxylase-like FAD-dependent oxidoreductase